MTVDLEAGNSDFSTFCHYRAIYLNIPGLVALLVVTVGCGLVIYAKYVGCDTVQLKRVQSADQVSN